jgi:hypothetical protein
MNLGRSKVACLFFPNSSQRLLTICVTALSYSKNSGETSLSVILGIAKYGSANGFAFFHAPSLSHSNEGGISLIGFELKEN